MQNQPVHQRLLDAVQHHILPRLRHRDLWQMVYASPPFKLPRGVTATYHAGAPLTTQEADPAYSSDLTHNWSALNLQSSRFPMMGFVLEGSIDWRVGITTRMAKMGDRQMKNSDYVTISMPKGSLILMPPGVPYSEGDLNHWQRSMDEGVDIKILWMQFHRFGMQCFLGYTTGGRHYRDSACYIADSRTLFAAETLIEELDLELNYSCEIVNTLLLFCFQRLERRLLGEDAEETGSIVPTSFSQSSNTEIVEQACVYIESNFDRPITLEAVATHVYISPSHLARLFQAEKGMSINEYVTRFRLDYACTLLTKTDLRINHIGKLAGYVNPSYFCQIFQRRLSCSPQQYRNDAINKLKAR